MMEGKFDVVIIGAGMSGLACASLIGQLYGLKVLVVEKHIKIGGLSQSYSKNGYSWEIGIHQIGELTKASLLNHVFKFITNGKVSLRKMPEVFINYHYPDFTYKIYDSPIKQKEYLLSLFPLERKAIDCYFLDIKKVSTWYIKYNSAINDKELKQKLLSEDISKTAFLTTREYLNGITMNERLKTYLASQWTDYGLPPSKSVFLAHSILATHMETGAYFPDSGSQGIVDVLQSVIVENGGSFLTNTTAEQIITDKTRVKSLLVRDNSTDKTHEIIADYFISTTGIINTYNNFLKEYVDKKTIQQILKIAQNGISHISVFAILKKDPSEFGNKGELGWIYNSFDHEEMYQECSLQSKKFPSQCTFSFPSLKRSYDQKHVMTINSLIDYSLFERWFNKKDKSYVDYKQTLGEALINTVEKTMPGIKNIIESWEISTPLSTEKITGHYRGFIYGLPSVPERYKDMPTNSETPFDNFHLSGVDITGFGFYGAITSAILAVFSIFNDRSFFTKILNKSYPK
ncbi:NAD(P)/FAD-dependent oxidoreductase [Parabacteroides sp. OttesenSCG-928-J18]|nr:NAD(P)/FAD-dependent oxidoreductase [Parabacteroides sp. OttesenSCG-928-J18]MDL2255229.1 NAD(P)/FAD-dependent oxidoreductase [Parabacteroides sp. OttesenSCG-928-K15]